MVDDLILGMAGSGGDGVVSAGESLLSAASSEGYHALMTKSFGSQIRGGESSCRVRLSTNKVLNPGGALDVAVALNWDDFFRFGAELPLSVATVFIYEEKAGPPPATLKERGVMPREMRAVPIGELAKKSAGTDKAKTSVVLGLLSGWFGIPSTAIARGLKKKFGNKGEGLLEANERALATGIEYATAHPLAEQHTLALPTKSGPKLLCDGNDMCAAGALFSGVQFFGGYPITPSTEVMQTLSKEIWKYGGVVLQAEDEIAGVGAALGASFAGKKSMTATSGPGMSLKTEILGLASLAELPLVLLNVQRGGPSTGLPTKPEQGDLFQAVFSAHGDVLRPVLAPTDVSDTFKITVEAFNIAEVYQTPVIILSDQEIAQRKEAIDPIDTSKLEVLERRRPTEAELVDYSRFKLTADSISPISHPGMKGGNYLGAGIEHNEKGEPTASGTMHARMNEKRFNKLDPLKKRTDLFEVSGDPKASIALIAWGSTAGVCREAHALAVARGLKVKLLVPYLLYPIAEEIYQSFFASVRSGLVVELAHQGQLYRILRMFTDVPRGLKSLARSGANPFQPSEIVSRLAEMSPEVN
ncbi:MAG: pyruvate flavodoxin/ferredoxin oxidoreductase domain protein [Myxococcaceae bacterium]|nr:pyruvate flavodoxin/ferredoxin oxidoreductase domain protein [Myxococcaceae bacterium]